MTMRVLFCSGGKDSVASLILAKIHNEPVDAVVFVEDMLTILDGGKAE